MYAALERHLAPGQTVSILQRFPPGEMDFRSVLSRIGNSKPDAVGVFVSVGQVASFYRQRRQLEMDIPTFGTNLFESVSEIEASGSTMDGALFANNEIHPDYISRFKQKFGHASQLAFGAPAYEFARALGTIIATASHRLSGAEFLNALENLPEQKGLAAGPYVFRNTPEAGKFFDFPLVVKEIRGREFVVVGKNLGQ
jgi:branched-chain amino acid transport system substrate-binding protein